MNEDLIKDLRSYKVGQRLTKIDVEAIRISSNRIVDLEHELAVLETASARELHSLNMSLAHEELRLFKAVETLRWYGASSTAGTRARAALADLGEAVG